MGAISWAGRRSISSCAPTVAITPASPDALRRRARERARARPDAWLYVHAQACETRLFRTLRMDRRRDRGGAADQGLVEGQEGGLYSRRFLGAGGALDERFKTARVTLGSRTAGAYWNRPSRLLLLRGSCFARAPQDEAGGIEAGFSRGGLGVT